MKLRFAILAAISMCSLAPFGTAANATPVAFSSTVTFTDSISELSFASAGLNGTLTLGVPDVIPQFITVTVGTGAWNALNSSLSANFTFTLPTPVGATTETGSINGGQVNGSRASGILSITWPNQPVEFDFADGTKLQVTLGALNYTCDPASNNCLAGQDPFYMSATFLATNGSTTGGSAVPEPGTLALLAAGIGGLGLLGRLRKRKQAASVAV